MRRKSEKATMVWEVGGLGGRGNKVAKQRLKGKVNVHLT